MIANAWKFGLQQSSASALCCCCTQLCKHTSSCSSFFCSILGEVSKWCGTIWRVDCSCFFSFALLQKTVPFRFKRYPMCIQPMCNAITEEDVHTKKKHYPLWCWKQRAKSKVEDPRERRWLVKLIKTKFCDLTCFHLTYNPLLGPRSHHRHCPPWPLCHCSFASFSLFFLSLHLSLPLPCFLHLWNNKRAWLRTKKNQRED